MWNGTLPAPSGVVPAIEQRVSAVATGTVEASLWVVVLSAVALDLCTTYVGLSAGLTEGNPAVRWAIGAFGFESLVFGKLVVLGGAGLLRERYPDYGTTIALGLAVPWGLAVVANVRTLAAL